MQGDSVIVGDIGGTHARFAIAHMTDGALPVLSEVSTLSVSVHQGLEDAMRNWLETVRGPRPQRANLAVACSTTWATPGETLSFPNSGWTLDAAALAEAMGLSEVRTLNDLEAMGHAVARARPEDLAPVCGPRDGLPAQGVVSVIGPGTGLGVAMLVRHGNGQAVIPTEAGHIGFAPADGLEDQLLKAMRRGLEGRVSVERLVSGGGLASVHMAMGGAPAEDRKSLWSDAVDGESSEMAATMERFLALLGSFAGDMALAQGARAVVIAGGLGARLGDRLSHPAFEERFCDKGRYRPMMQRIPVMRLMIPEPGLVGAALA